METVEDMGKNRRIGSRSGPDLRSMGHGLSQRYGEVWGRFVQRAAGIGLEVIHRETLCFAIAAIFAMTVVVPGILIFWDRGAPLEFVDATVVGGSVLPGQRAETRFTVRQVTKECRGRVERFFYDSAGKGYFLGEGPTIYHRMLDGADHGAFSRGWTVPADAAPGKGTYIAYPEFWCQPLQFLWPIKAPPQKASVLVIKATN